MVAVIFRFDLIDRSKRVEKGQFSKFKILKKRTFLTQFHLRNPTVLFVFVYNAYKWPKNVIYFYDVTTFHTYYSHLGSKIDIQIWNLACELLSYVSYTYNTVLSKFWKFGILEHLFQKNLFFEIFGVKIQKFWNSEIPIL